MTGSLREMAPFCWLAGGQAPRRESRRVLCQAHWRESRCVLCQAPRGVSRWVVCQAHWRESRWVLCQAPRGESRRVLCSRPGVLASCLTVDSCSCIGGRLRRSTVRGYPSAVSKPGREFVGERQRRRLVPRPGVGRPAVVWICAEYFRRVGKRHTRTLVELQGCIALQLKPPE